jgi:hypothetical protein
MPEVLFQTWPLKQKKPGAEERMFPDHRYCLSNFLIAYNLRREVFPWLFMAPTDPVSPLESSHINPPVQ